MSLTSLMTCSSRNGAVSYSSTSTMSAQIWRFNGTRDLVTPCTSITSFRLRVQLIYPLPIKQILTSAIIRFVNTFSHVYTIACSNSIGLSASNSRDMMMNGWISSLIRFTRVAKYADFVLNIWIQRLVFFHLTSRYRARFARSVSALSWPWKGGSLGVTPSLPPSSSSHTLAWLFYLRKGCWSDPHAANVRPLHGWLKRHRFN